MNLYKRYYILLLIILLFFFGITINAEETSNTAPRPAAPVLNQETIPPQHHYIPATAVNTTVPKTLSSTPVGESINNEVKNDSHNVTPIISKTKNTAQSTSSAVNGSNRTNSTKQTYKNQMQNVDFGPYMREVQRSIKQNWNPPKGHTSKRIVVLFKIAKDGTLLSNKIVKTSGIVEADDAALEAVRKTAPFKPLPLGFMGSSVDIQFTFDYNVISSSNKQSSTTETRINKSNQNTASKPVKQTIHIETENNNVTTTQNNKDLPEYLQNETRNDGITNILVNIGIILAILVSAIAFVCIIAFFFRRNSQIHSHDIILNNLKKDTEKPLPYQVYSERTVDIYEEPKIIYVKQKKNYTWYILVVLTIIGLILAYLQTKGYINLY